MSKPKRNGGHVGTLAATLAPLDDIACTGPPCAEPALWYSECPFDTGMILRRGGVHLFAGLPPREAWMLGAAEVRERAAIVEVLTLLDAGLKTEKDAKLKMLHGIPLCRHSNRASLAPPYPHKYSTPQTTVNPTVVRAARVIWRCVIALPDAWWAGVEAPPADDMVATAAKLGVEIPEAIVGIWRDAACDLATKMRLADRAQPIDGRAWAPPKILSAAEKNVAVGRYIEDMAAGRNPELPEGVAEPDRPISPTARTVVAVPRAIRRV